MPKPDSSQPSLPSLQPPGEAEANAEALERASDQLGEASEAVAAARGEMQQAAARGGAAAQEARAAEEALEAAEEALADASEQLAEAASEGGGDPAELQESVAAAQEALAAAEQALAAAEAAAEQEALADAASSGDEEPLPAAEEIPAGGGAESLAAAEDSPAGGGASGGGAPDSGAPGGGASGAGAAGGGEAGGASGGGGLAGSEEPAAGGGAPGVLVVAVSGAQRSLEQSQTAIDGAIRALIIAGVYEPGSSGSLDEAGGLPAGGVLVLMPGQPDENDKVAQLEGELEQTLVVIDGRLLEERDRLANQRPGGIPDLPGIGGDETFGEDPGAEAEALLEELGGDGMETGIAGESDEELPAGAVADTGPDESGDGQRASNTQRPDNIPDNIPDGSDDDIVARQIREAAMNETDPVLREKLWREYINYKKGGG